ncbi:hypothetical protein NR798_00800 [Archangium gephyra]|uniref:hypothetical protein n=1 Tax=Archangium gephyra TaxID=48 RepID=UPI0035D5265C
MTIEDAPEDTSVSADGVLHARIQRQMPAAIVFVLVDVDEDDVSLTADKIALSLKPVAA